VPDPKAPQERDAESQLDQTPGRTYEPRLMRWLSPDPVAGDVMNPQSLPERAGIFDNRYAYVLNNPTTLIDPLGLQPPDCSKAPDPRACAQRIAPYWQGFAAEMYGVAIGRLGVENSLWRIGVRPGQPCRGCAGHNIFDAVMGMPGTYISYDQYGNMSFGFDIDLYYKTMNAIEAFRGGTSLLSQKTGLYAGPESLLATGFVEVRRSLGTRFGDFFEQPSGPIYGLFALQDEYRGKSIQQLPLDRVLQLIRQLGELSAPGQKYLIETPNRNSGASM